MTSGMSSAWTHCNLGQVLRGQRTPPVIQDVDPSAQEGGPLPLEELAPSFTLLHRLQGHSKIHLTVAEGP